MKYILILILSIILYSCSSIDCLNNYKNCRVVTKSKIGNSFEIGIQTSNSHKHFDIKTIKVTGYDYYRVSIGEIVR